MLQSNKKLAYVAGLSIVEKLLQKFPEAMLFGGALRDKILHHSVTGPIMDEYQHAMSQAPGRHLFRQLNMEYHFAMEDASVTPKDWDIYVPTSSMASDVKFYLRTEEHAIINENVTGSFPVTRDDLLVTSIEIMDSRHASTKCIYIDLVCPTVDNTPLSTVDCDVNSLAMKGDGVVYSRLQNRYQSMWARSALMNKIENNIKEKIFEPKSDQGVSFTREKRNHILSRFDNMIRKGWKCMINSEDGKKYYQKNDGGYSVESCEECNRRFFQSYTSESNLLRTMVKVSHGSYEGKDGNAYIGVYTFCHIGCMKAFTSSNYEYSPTPSPSPSSENNQDVIDIEGYFQGEFLVSNEFTSEPLILSPGMSTSPAVSPVESTISNESERSSTCVVCMENLRNVVFLPCAHFALCDVCAANVEKCPSCRCEIDSRIQVFIP